MYQNESPCLAQHPQSGYSHSVTTVDQGTYTHSSDWTPINNNIIERDHSGDLTVSPPPSPGLSCWIGLVRSACRAPSKRCFSPATGLEIFTEICHFDRTLFYLNHWVTQLLNIFRSMGLDQSSLESAEFSLIPPSPESEGGQSLPPRPARRKGSVMMTLASHFTAVLITLLVVTGQIIASISPPPSHIN